MRRATPWLNRRAREALGQRLRTNSEFDAFVLDHFAHVLSVLPSNGASRLDRETGLLHYVGAHAVLQALYGPRYYAAWLLMAVCSVGAVALVGGAAFWLTRKEPLQAAVTAPPTAISATPSQAKEAPGPSGLPLPTVQAKGPALAQTDQHEGSPAGQPTSRPVAPRAHCGQGVLVSQQTGSLRYQTDHPPAGHGYIRGSKLVLLAAEGPARGRRLGYGTVVDAEPAFLSLVAEHLEQPPLRACIAPLPEVVQLGRGLGKLLDDGRINLGSGDGVHIGDVYEVLGGSVADADVGARSLGRQAVGRVVVTAVETAFSSITVEQGLAQPGSFVRALRTAKPGESK